MALFFFREKNRITSDPAYLYRGLRKEEVTARQLIPKGVETFNGPMFVVAEASGTYTHVGGEADMALRHLEGLPTQGISTSKDIAIADYYARHAPTEFQYVVRIRRDLLSMYGIREFDVILLGLKVPKPQDAEVILISPQGVFPRELIDRAFRVNGSGEMEQADF